MVAFQIQQVLRTVEQGYFPVATVRDCSDTRPSQNRHHACRILAFTGKPNYGTKKTGPRGIGEPPSVPDSTRDIAVPDEAGVYVARLRSGAKENLAPGFTSAVGWVRDRGFVWDAWPP
jgi:hypothetical protein